MAGWAGAAVMAVANGGGRERLLTPRLGEDRAQRVSSLSLVLLLAGYGLALQHARPIPTARGALRVGTAWVGLTVAFESALGRAQGQTWRALLGAYDVRRGNLWGLVVLWIGALPPVKPLGGAATRRMRRGRTAVRHASCCGRGRMPCCADTATE